MHYVHGEVTRHGQWLVGQATEKGLFAKTKLQTSPPIVPMSTRSQQTLHILIIFPWQFTPVQAEVFIRDVGVTATRNTVIERTPHYRVVMTVAFAATARHVTI